MGVGVRLRPFLLACGCQQWAVWCGQWLEPQSFQSLLGSVVYGLVGFLIGFLYLLVNLLVSLGGGSVGLALSALLGSLDLILGLCLGSLYSSIGSGGSPDLGRCCPSLGGSGSLFGSSLGTGGKTLYGANQVVDSGIADAMVAISLACWFRYSCALAA